MMTRDEFTARLGEIGFEQDDDAVAWRRNSDGAAVSVEFIDDFLALWGDKLAEEALALWAGGAKTIKVVADEKDGAVVARLEAVE